MAAFELPEMPQPRMSPELLMGAASPLWGYFGACAAGGVAYWWMTRAFQPVNLEAFFDAAARLAEPVVEPALETAQATAETIAEEPVILRAAAEDAAAAVEPAAAATPIEPPSFAPESAAAEPDLSDAAKPRLRKAPPPAPQA